MSDLESAEASRGAARVRSHLLAPVDSASFVVFRVLFGLLLAGAAVRYELAGWVHDLYIAPTFRFPYPGFFWLSDLFPLGSEGEIFFHGAFVALFCLGLAIASGVQTRLFAALYFMVFTSLELIDRTNYLNHYYLVSLLSLYLALVPPSRLSAPIPRWALWLFRAQLCLVYFYAGVAKLRSDWLFAGSPLRLWLRRHEELPVLGELFSEPSFALFMSWSGAIFDLTICALLLHQRTRPGAYVVVVFFHVVTWLLFPIGVFPWVMIICTTLFFSPSWPRKLAARLWRFKPVQGSTQDPAPSRWPLYIALVLIAAQLVFPLRRFVYEGRSEWHESGFRFGWNVMVMEKQCLATFVVRDARGETVVHPREELTPLQMRMMQTQPDMILTYAHHLEGRWITDGYVRDPSEVEVHADVTCSLNGRPRQTLIDPEADLTEVNILQDGLTLSPRPWVLLFEGETLGPVSKL